MADFASLAYWVRPGPRPFVLLHGLGYDATMWHGVIAALPPGVGVLAMDIRGHGGSTLGTASPSVDQWARDVMDLVEAEGLDKPAVCGLSMGGYTTFAVAAAARDRCRAFGFVSTAAGADTPEKRQSRAEGIELLRRSGADAFCEGLLDKLLWPEHPNYAEHAAEARRLFRNAGAVALAHTMTALANRRDRLPLLPRVTQPSAVVVGDQDILTPLEGARLIAEGLPNAQLHLISGAAHMSAVEQPEAVAEALARL
jgi:pimeloyl-ACP methyl ester carboxylesterase